MNSYWYNTRVEVINLNIILMSESSISVFFSVIFLKPLGQHETLERDDNMLQQNTTQYPSLRDSCYICFMNIQQGTEQQEPKEKETTLCVLHNVLQS